MLLRTRLAASAATGLVGLALAGAAAAQTTPAGRLLASNCFQCHGTNGRGPGFETLAGKSASEIVKELNEMRSGREGVDLMSKHAMGYTDAQIRQLASWLATQR